MSNKRLTARELRFVQEYIVDQNASEAARRAGVDPDRASDEGYRMLQRPHVQRAIAERMRLVARKVDVRSERIVAELARLGFSDMGDYADLRVIIDPVTGERRIEAQLKPWDGTVDTAAIQELSIDDKGRVKIKLYNKREALETLARMIGALKPDGGVEGDFVVRILPPGGDRDA